MCKSSKRLALFLSFVLFQCTLFLGTLFGGPTVEELISFTPPKGWVGVKAKAETPVRIYIPHESPKAGVRISLAINEKCQPGLGPRQYGFKNIVRFFGMADRAVATAKKEGKTLRRDKFACETFKASFSFENAKMHALKISRPFPYGSAFKAYVFRIAFSDKGVCYRLTLQGPEEVIHLYTESVFQSFGQTIFKEMKEATK